MKDHYIPTPIDTIHTTISELNKIKSLIGLQVLDFGCGEDRRVGLEAEKLGAEVTYVDIDFHDKIDGFNLDWKEFDVIIFSWGVKNHDLFVEKWKEKTDSTKKDTVIALILGTGYFWRLSNSLVTDTEYFANKLETEYTKCLSGAILAEGDEFERRIQFYKNNK